MLGPTATGKSALALALARHFGGEIVNCDSTAVYRGFDIGTDKVPPRRAAGHSAPSDRHRRARPTTTPRRDFARDAAAAIGEIHARGRLPVLVGGTGFYYRALTRGLFPGPGHDAALRARLERLAARRGDGTAAPLAAPASTRRRRRASSRRDRKRIVRALEVFFQTGRPLTAHFDATVSPLARLRRARRRAAAACRRAGRSPGAPRRPAVCGRAARRGPRAAGARRAAPRRGRSAASSTGRRWSTCEGVRDEPATRALIVQENRRYARRQLIWFRKEPNSYVV